MRPLDEAILVVEALSEKLSDLSRLLADAEREHDRVVEDLCDDITKAQWVTENLLDQIALHHPDSPILQFFQLEEEKKVWARTHHPS